jgi:hypothetical protein
MRGAGYATHAEDAMKAYTRKLKLNVETVRVLTVASDAANAERGAPATPRYSWHSWCTEATY